MCFGFGCPRICTPEDYKLLCAVPAVSWNDFTPAIAGTVHVKTFFIHLPLSLCSWHNSFFILMDGENVFSSRGKKGIKALLWNSIQNAHVRRKTLLKCVFVCLILARPVVFSQPVISIHEDITEEYWPHFLYCWICWYFYLALQDKKVALIKFFLWRNWGTGKDWDSSA